MHNNNNTVYHHLYKYIEETTTSRSKRIVVKMFPSLNWWMISLRGINYTLGSKYLFTKLIILWKYKHIGLTYVQKVYKYSRQLALDCMLTSQSSQLSMQWEKQRQSSVNRWPVDSSDVAPQWTEQWTKCGIHIVVRCYRQILVNDRAPVNTHRMGT